jgi:hypothetical protein|tara:strand:- start:102 stop:305 length:204 start_codon:yes stop_codon:yes gene_type:complete
MKNIFSDPKELKKWCVTTANACGGQEVGVKGMNMNPTSMSLLQKQMDKFIEDYEKTRVAIDEQKEEE